MENYFKTPAHGYETYHLRFFKYTPLAYFTAVTSNMKKRIYKA